MLDSAALSAYNGATVARPTDKQRLTHNARDWGRTSIHPQAIVESASNMCRQGIEIARPSLYLYCEWACPSCLLQGKRPLGWHESGHIHA